MVIPAWENRFMMSKASPALGLPSICTRRAGLVVWTETLMGEMRRSIMRWTSRGERFVRVR